MATRTISNTGGNWGATAAWVGGVVPLAGDTVVATATSGPLTINVTTPMLAVFDMTNYTNTLTINATFQLVVQTTIIFSATMTTAGTGTLNAQGATMTCNGTTCVPAIQFGGTSVTNTLVDNWTTTNGIILAGATAITINGGTLTTAGGISVTIGIPYSGTTTFIITGGTWSASAAGTIKNNITFAGNSTISGTVNYNTGTLTYTSGTITNTATLNCVSSTTFNTGSMSWNNITISAGATLTLLSNLTLSGTLTAAGNIGFTGAFTIAGNVTVAAGATVTIANTFNQTGTFTCSGSITFSGAFAINVGTFVMSGTSTTITLSGNLTATGDLTFSGVTATTFAGGFNIQGTTATVTGAKTIALATSVVTVTQLTTITNATTLTSTSASTWTTAGLTTTATLTSTTVSLNFQGTGTWTGAAGSLNVPNILFTIGGNFTISGTCLTNASGVSFTSSFIASGTGTIKFGAASIWTMPAGGTCIIPGISPGAFAYSLQPFSSGVGGTLSIGTLTMPDGNATFQYLGTNEILNLSVGTFTNTPLTASRTYTIPAGSKSPFIITGAFTIVGATSAIRLAIKSGTPGGKATFILSPVASQDIAYTDPTDVDSSAGQQVFTYKGVVSTTFNWTNTYPAPPPIGKLAGVGAQGAYW